MANVYLMLNEGNCVYNKSIYLELKEISEAYYVNKKQINNVINFTFLNSCEIELNLGKHIFCVNRKMIFLFFILTYRHFGRTT